jgi:hypothetical protein
LTCPGLLPAEQSGREMLQAINKEARRMAGLSVQ